VKGKERSPRSKKRKNPRGNEPRNFDLDKELMRIFGVNLCSIDGVGVMVVQTGFRRSV